MVEWYSVLLNPITMLGVIAMMMIIAICAVLILKFRPTIRAMYITESSHTGQELGVKKETPISCRCEQNKRFLRNASAYTFKSKLRAITTYFCKRGTAWTFYLREGTIDKVGTLYTALCALWGEDVVNNLKDNLKNPLMKSEIWVSVDLEAGLRPQGTKYNIDEEDVTTEANENMANLIAEGIKEAKSHEDWVKIFLGLGAGAAIPFILNALGIIKM